MCISVRSAPDIGLAARSEIAENRREHRTPGEPRIRSCLWVMTVPYSRSARVYDLLYTSGIKDFAADVDAVHRLIAERNPGARTLLDVACGTGIHLAALREWYEGAGVDASSDMLAVARERLGGAAQLTRGDLVSFDL